MKELLIDNIKYTSIKDASKKLNIPYSTINYRLKSPNFVNYVRGKIKLNRFTAKVKLSNKFCFFFNLEKNSEISRVDLTRLITRYIKDNGLQNPTNKREIIPDSALKKLLNIKSNEKLSFYNLQKFILYSGAFPYLKKIHKPKNIIKYKDYKYQCSIVNGNDCVYKEIFHKNNLLSFFLGVYKIESYKIECKEIFKDKFELKIIDFNNVECKKTISKLKLLNMIKKNEKLNFVQNYINSLNKKNNNEIVI